MRPLLWVFAFQGLFAQEANFEDYLRFYNELVSEQRAVGCEVYPCTTSSSSTVPPGNYLPIVVQNNSQVSDPIYLTVIGTNNDTKNQVYLTFGASLISGSQVGGFIDVQAVPDGTEIPSYQINSSDGSSTFYLPPVSGGRLYFSRGSPLTLKTLGGGIVTPSVTNPSLPEYNIMFDVVEIAYIEGAGDTSVNPNATAVAFFSMPLEKNLSTPAPGTSATTGLSTAGGGKRSDILAHASTLFNMIPASTVPADKDNIKLNWTNLFSPSHTPSSSLRILSPATAMTLSDVSVPWMLKYAFDPNYLDNETDYGYSFLKNVWYGTAPASYYRTNLTDLYIQSPHTMTSYNGTILGTMQSDSAVCFVPCPQAGPTVCSGTGCEVYDAPSNMGPGGAPYKTTSWKIFGAENLGTYPTADGEDNQVSKLFEEAVIAGLIPYMYPMGSPLSETRFVTFGTSQYYDQTGIQAGTLPNNTNMTAPWYDLYSRALHTVSGSVTGVSGQVYTYGFDEPLWPDVKSNGPFISGSTKVTITIGNLN
jgi:hypothetical protein